MKHIIHANTKSTPQFKHGHFGPDKNVKVQRVQSKKVTYARFYKLLKVVSNDQWEQKISQTQDKSIGFLTRILKGRRP